GIIHRGQPHCTQRALKSVCTTIITDPAVHTFFLQRSRALPALHSFPTRRSSDLNAIVRRGYTPVFVDIDPETFNLSPDAVSETLDRKSTRLNSSHVAISYAVFCLKKKKITPCSPRSRRCSPRKLGHDTYSQNTPS